MTLIKNNHHTIQTSGLGRILKDALHKSLRGGNALKRYQNVRGMLFKYAEGKAVHAHDRARLYRILASFIVVDSEKAETIVICRSLDKFRARLWEEYGIGEKTESVTID